MDIDKIIIQNREFLKSFDFDAPEWKDIKWEPDQRKGVDPPPRQKPYPEDAELIDLIMPKDLTVGQIPLIDAIRGRQSHRKFKDAFLTLEELSFLVWSTQGIKEIDGDGVWTKRTVPSGGARHPFVTYLIVGRVEGLKTGLYRYVPFEHKLLFLKEGDSELPSQVTKACFGQEFVGNSAVVFVWATIPYRTEWRYSLTGHKDIAIEAGHVCQNLYLACEAIGAGTCAIAAYDQKIMDQLIGVDGVDEFTIYLSPVGKVST